MSEDQKEKSFEERLAKAQGSAKLGRQPRKMGEAASLDGNALRLALRLGVEMVAALVIAVVIGWGLDRLLHTRPLFMIAFVPLGAAAGLRNVFRAMGPGGKA
ncbi:AtpZ/AtpI family protein [Acidisoma sp. C75]